MNFRMIFGAALICALMAVQAAADGKIISLNLTEGPAISETSTSKGNGKGSKKKQQASMMVVLKVDTVSGNEYQLQATGSLASGIWDDIGTIFTATQSVTEVSTPESDAYRFFRVVALTEILAPPPPPPPPPPLSI